MKGRVNDMALESIGVKSSIAYTDVVKQAVNREPRAVQNQETTAELSKRTTTPVSNEVKGTEPQPGHEEENVSRRMKNAIDKVNDKMRPTKTKCEFSYHEETKRVSIKVIDEETEEVIRGIPPEETLEMITKAWELAGLLVDERR